MFGTSTWATPSPPLVLEFGRALTKIGVAGEHVPRHIFPTPELFYPSHTTSPDDPHVHPEGKVVRVAKTLRDWIGILEPVLERVFFLFLKADPKDRRIVLIDPVFAPAGFRNSLFFLLFERYRVASICQIPDACCSLYLSNFSGGVSVDVGYASTRVVPVFAGLPLRNAAVEVAYGGRLVDRRLRKLLADRGYVHSASSPGEDEERELFFSGSANNLLEKTVHRSYYGFVVVDGAPTTAESEKLTNAALAHPDVDPDAFLVSEIKTKCCYFRFGYLGEKPSNNRFVLEDDIEFARRDTAKTRVKLNAAERYRILESCFTEPELDIVAALFECLEQCPIDTRKLLVQNIVICGGGAMPAGFLPRLAQEVFARMKQTGKKKSYLQRGFEPLFATIPFVAPVLRTWVGASACGALPTTVEYTAAMYFAKTPLPDWAASEHV